MYDVSDFAGFAGFDSNGTPPPAEWERTTSSYFDPDNDGDVDGTDFLEWQRSLGTIYDATDLSIWETNFGNAPLAATVSIPEPTTLTLSTLALLGMGYRRRRWG